VQLLYITVGWLGPWLIKSLSAFVVLFTKKKKPEENAFNWCNKSNISKKNWPSSPEVNFINVKRANFSYECHVSAAFSSYMYVDNDVRMKNSYEKCWWNWHLQSISPTFASSFCANIFGQKITKPNCPYRKAAENNLVQKNAAWNLHCFQFHQHFISIK